MAKKGYSIKGFFGRIIQCDGCGKKIGESRLAIVQFIGYNCLLSYLLKNKLIIKQNAN